MRSSNAASSEQSRQAQQVDAFLNSAITAAIAYVTRPTSTIK